MAGAIVLDMLAFVVWNIGTRTPLALLRDLRRGLHDARVALIGAISFLVGLIFITAATVLLSPAIADLERDFLPVELFTLLVGLALEHVVGDDLRALSGSRDKTGQ